MTVTADTSGTNSLFESLMISHRRRAWAFAYRLSGNREEADDLIQDAFLRAYRAFDQFDDSRSFERWLFRIIDNLFKDRLRSRKGHVVYSLDSPIPGSDEGTLPEIPDDSNDPAKMILRDVTDERIIDALTQIPDAFRWAIVLIDVDGRSYEESSRIMRCSIGTVRSRLHRGRLLARQILLGQPVSRRRRRNSRRIAEASIGGTAEARE